MEKSKGKKKITAFIIVIAVIGGIVFGAFSYVKNFASYTPEEYDKAAVVVSDRYVVLADKTIKIESPSAACEIFDVYCIEQGKVFFAYGTGGIWNVASTDFTGKNITVYYKYENAGKYERLSCLSDYKDAMGGLYNNGKIYLKGNEGIVELNLASQEVKMVKALPAKSYYWTNDNGTFRVGKKNDLKEITIDNMAKKNSSAYEIKEIADKKNSKFITEISCINDQVYISGIVENPLGIKYGVLFSYYPDSDSFKYIDTGITKTDAYPIPVISYFGKK